MTRETFLKILEKALQEHLKAHGKESLNDLSFDESLIAAGIIDSLKFVEFLLTLEAETGIETDFAAHDAQTLTSINGLVSIYCQG